MQLRGSSAHVLLEPSIRFVHHAIHAPEQEVEVVGTLELDVGMALSTDQSSKVLPYTFRQSIEQLKYESFHAYLGSLVSLGLSIGQGYEVLRLLVGEELQVPIRQSCALFNVQSCCSPRSECCRWSCKVCALDRVRESHAIDLHRIRYTGDTPKAMTTGGQNQVRL